MLQDFDLSEQNESRNSRELITENFLCKLSQEPPFPGALRAVTPPGALGVGWVALIFFRLQDLVTQPPHFMQPFERKYHWAKIRIVSSHAAFLVYNTSRTNYPRLPITVLNTPLSIPPVSKNTPAGLTAER